MDGQTPHDDIGRAYASHRAAKIEYVYATYPRTFDFKTGTHLAGPHGRYLVDEDAVSHLLQLLRHDDQTFESFQQVTKTLDDHVQQTIVPAP